MLRIYPAFLFMIIVALAAACSDDYDLKKSIFIPDNTNPGLPVYSEQGYNTFGVYYDRVPFVSGEATPVKIVVEEDNTSFTFIGVMGSYPGEEMSITLIRNAFDPQDYKDLLSLHNTTVDLEDADYTVVVENAEGTFTAEIISGTFTFKRAQNLLVDKQHVEVILSGTFEFQAVINEDPITVSGGRFDVGVGSHNFYRF